MSEQLNRGEFKARLDRIQSLREQGRSFEAEGTVARPVVVHQPSFIQRAARVVLAALTVAWIIKGTILFLVGAPTYHTRITKMANGTEFDPIAAVIMAPDPVSQALAKLLGDIFPTLKK